MGSSSLVGKEGLTSIGPGLLVVEIVFEEGVVDDGGEIVVESVSLEVGLKGILELRGKLAEGQGVVLERSRGKVGLRGEFVGSARLCESDRVDLQNAFLAGASKDHLLLLVVLGDNNVEDVVLTLEEVVRVIVVMMIVINSFFMIVLVIMLSFKLIHSLGAIIGLGHDLNDDAVVKRRVFGFDMKIDRLRDCHGEKRIIKGQITFGL